MSDHEIKHQKVHRQEAKSRSYENDPQLYRRGLTVALVIGAVFTFALGIVLPLVEIEKLVFFTQTPSLIDIVYGLAGDSEWALAIIVAVFSIIFPAVKISALASTVILPGRWPKLAHALHALGRWSLMDVLLVALVIFAAKTSGLATAASQPGIWFYAIATALTAVGSYWIED